VGFGQFVGIDKKVLSLQLAIDEVIPPGLKPQFMGRLNAGMNPGSSTMMTASV
jgi:hypothetical protein